MGNWRTGPSVGTVQSVLVVLLCLDSALMLWKNAEAEETLSRVFAISNPNLVNGQAASRSRPLY